MSSAEIRTRFLAHFERRAHVVVPSASLIADDPTLLLVNAGMVPFKPFFLGEATPPGPRVTSVQKCVRTLDIEEVGKTTRHGSFFQMAGNFSFGDYFKAEAVEFAWELLTGSLADGGFALPEERLWPTVYLDDEEAYELWRARVPADRIQRRDKADNYWHMGVPGPGGPCSEIYFDRGPRYGVDGGPVANEERYLEVWNLVFMQFQLSAVRTKVDFDVAGPLPAQNIDTGMGLERVATVLQGVDNLYEIDTSRAILDRAAELTGARYGADPASDVRLRVVADHARTAVMLIGDGVTPSNEGRGYVLRRILRRTVRSMRLLGAAEPVVSSLVEASIGAMGPQYPDLVEGQRRVQTVAVAEENAFLETLTKGATVFDTAVPAARSAGNVLSGAAAFSLHDTYGFPIDLTLEMAAEQGLSVDEPGFRALMAEQRNRAKADARDKKGVAVADTSAYRALLDSAGSTEFTGYTEVVSEGTVRGLLLDGAAAQAAGEGSSVDVVLDRSPFYAEGGGQQADHGRLVLADGTELQVSDVQKVVDGLTVHRATVVSGELRVGTAVQAEVDVERRRAVSRAHTATHLVHKALRDALGEQATQAGSRNLPGRFTFDFASPAAVPVSVLADVEAQINEIALADLEVRAFVTTQDEARRIGAMALFGEKYGDAVRVVEVGDYARELCGGTHAARSGQLGMVKLLSEASIGSGVRRVEGLVGRDAYDFLAREHVLLSQLAAALKVPSAEVPERVAATVARLREVEKELAGVRAGAVLQQAGAFAAAAKDVYGVAFAAVEAPAGTSGDLVRQLAMDVRGRLSDRPAVVIVAAGGDRVTLVAAVNEAGRARGLSANAVLREAAPAVDGKGGGKDDVAQGGGTKVAGIAEALTRAEHLVGRVATGG